ncbi:MAG: tetratricopeptide repeat protein [Cyanobacteria bacterium J06555_13]
MGQTIQSFPASTPTVDISKLNPVEELSGETAKAYYFRATARHMAGRYEEAVADYGKALELDPTMVIAGKLQKVTARKLNAK